MRTFRLAIAQMNATVGDLHGNTRKILNYIDQSRSLGADLVALPELAITGYPPEDLLFKQQFIQDNIRHMKKVVQASKDIAVVVGFVNADSDIHNAAALAYDGKLVDIYHKMYLPNYGVFDEDRYFKSGDTCPVYVINGTPIGINICEDIWYAIGPTAVQRGAGAEVIVNINGSPFYAGKRTFREKMLSTRAADNELFVAYVNMVGGQDELIFDGGSMVFDQKGNLVVSGSQFEEELMVVDLSVESVFRARLRSPRRRKVRASILEEVGSAKSVHVSDYFSGQPKPSIPYNKPVILEPLGEIYKALVTGTRDYVRKCGFSKVIIGMSGGIDSSLVAVIAVDALGKENVLGLAMPSRYTSKGSTVDANTLAQNLGIELWALPIENSFSAYLQTLDTYFNDTEPNVSEENIQSRIRGNLAMAISNKFGWLVLTTGNKSEMATGYATLYGDMAGGFAVIKDVTKTLVYKLSIYRNSIAAKSIIPNAVLEKPPSAELRPDQTDQDTLPQYDVLDAILEAYVEEDYSINDILAMGFEESTVRQIIAMVDRNEYKRRQSPPGVKITQRSFGRDRRMPIANRYKPF